MQYDTFTFPHSLLFLLSTNIAYNFSVIKQLRFILLYKYHIPSTSTATLPHIHNITYTYILTFPTSSILCLPSVHVYINIQ